MKNNLLIVLLLFFSLPIAAESTTDYLTISDLTLTPGGKEGMFTVSLVGSRKYCAYGMDIYLPDGLDVCLYDGEPDVYQDENDELYPVNRRGVYNHVISPSLTTKDGKRVLRIGCIDMGSESEFLSESGVLFYVMVKANTYMKPGDYDMKIDGITLSKDIDDVMTKFVPSDVTSRTLHISENNVKGTVSVSATHNWSTLVLPFSTSIPEGVTAYTCDEYTTNEESELLILKKAESFEAYTPYILYSEAGYSGTLSGTVDPANWPEDNVCKAGKLYGALTTQAIGEGHFVLQNQGDGAKFYKIDSNDTFSIPAGKCYLGPDVAGTKSFGFITEDEYETSISDVTKVVSDDIYTIQGVKVNEMLPGNIYIKGGKTILKLK